MAKKDFTLVSKVLLFLLGAADMVLVTPDELRRRLRRGTITARVTAKPPMALIFWKGMGLSATLIKTTKDL